MIEAPEVRVADECWIALALLHREHPERLSFSPREIFDRLKLEKVHPEVRPGAQPHIYLHNVANIRPNSAKYRLFYRLDDGTLRLLRPGDDFDPARTGKTKPERSDLPPRYHQLLDWYESEYCVHRGGEDENSDPVLQMRGVGKEIWAEEGADAFVARQREGWEDAGRLMDASGERELMQRMWDRVVAHKGEEFHTRTGKPFTYTVEGNSAIRFYRNGKRIEKRLWRKYLEKAVSRCPLDKATDISDCYHPAYLFGLLIDGRIRDKDW